MMRLTETAAGLTLAYPAWLALAFLAGSIAVGWHVSRHFAWNGKTFGFVMATGLCVYGGIYFFTFKTALTPEGARVYAFLKSNERMAWGNAARVGIEERPGKGRPTYVVVRSGAGESLEIPVTDLPETGRQRILDYIAARTGQPR